MYVNHKNVPFHFKVIFLKIVDILYERTHLWLFFVVDFVGFASPQDLLSSRLRLF